MIYSILPINGKFLKYSHPKSAYLYYGEYRINLISGKKEKYDFFNWLNKLDDLKISDEVTKRVIHLYYELSYLFLFDEKIGPDVCLAIDITYQRSCYMTLPDLKNKISLSLKSQVMYEQYKKDFLKGREELLKGNCYQFNLTYKFVNKFDAKITPYDFIGKLWKNKNSIGAYAHATYIESQGLLLLSNSPECLFQLKSHKRKIILDTMPIKGSLKCDFDENKNNLSKIYQKLIGCEKNKAELNMITDLLRNDLSKIERPRAKVIFKSRPLYVPGIVHQYSLIRILLSENIGFYKIVRALFPGGSITGAPKKSVVNILRKLESRDRGAYCGSTIVLDNKIKAASINIRTAEINFFKNELVYSAGGGVTLKSDLKDEFEEMNLKYLSFINLFK